MTKRTRTIFFIGCVILFALAAPSVILYSQGYRPDFENKRIVQTGGLYFKVSPNRADVYLNDKLEKSTSMITGSVYIENLLPKNYDIEIKKDGYRAWKKTLEVKGREVTEAENVTLFPKNPKFSIVSKIPSGITSSATSTDKKKFLEADNYEIRIELLGKDLPAGRQGEKVFLTRFSEKIGDIFWLNDNYLIFNAGNKIKIAEIDNRDGLNIVDLAEFENPKIAWDKNSKKLYVLSGNKTYLLENLLP